MSITPTDDDFFNENAGYFVSDKIRKIFKLFDSDNDNLINMKELRGVFN